MKQPYFCLIAFIFFYSWDNYAQESIENSKYDEFISANMMAYNLAHHIYSDEKCYDPNYLRGQYDRNLNRYRIIKSELYEYPKKNIELYYLEDKLKVSFCKLPQIRTVYLYKLHDKTNNLIAW